jgi:hypothetical protein
MTIYLAPLVCLIGLLAYGFSTSAKIQQLGLYAFAVALLVTLQEFSARVLHLP